MTWTRLEKPVVALALGVLLPIGFFSVATIVEQRLPTSAHWPKSPVDDFLPLVPAAVWVYASWYIAPALLLLLRGSAFRRAWLSEAIVFGLCCVGFLLWPAQMHRPVLPPDSGLSLAALRILYAVDPPVNVFPSFHAAMSWLVAEYIQPRSAFLRVIVRLWMLAIGLACVLTKQHYAVDVIAGVLLAIGVSRVVSSTLRGRDEIDVETAYESAARDDVGGRAQVTS